MTRLFLAFALLLSSCEPKEPADTVLLNGKVVTLDAAGTIVQAIAVREGRILAVGTNDVILDHAGSATERIDLEGKTVVPGLADNHYHSIGGGPGVDLSRTRTLQDVLDAIAARAKETRGRDRRQQQRRHDRLASRGSYRDDHRATTRVRGRVAGPRVHSELARTAKFDRQNAESPPEEASAAT
jgi:imidazolonepropionase-like amidohydrolase